jgi:hypothetical protein
MGNALIALAEKQSPVDREFFLAGVLRRGPVRRDDDAMFQPTP